MATVSKSQFLSAVSTVSAVIGPKSQHGMALLAEDEALSVQGWSDKHRCCRVTIPLMSYGKFEGLLQPAKLQQLLSTIDDDQLEIDVTGTKSKRQLTLKGTSNRFSLALSGELADMPPIEDIDVVGEFSIGARELIRSLSCALPMCADDSVRFAYGGVHISIGDRITFTGTDSRRLLFSPRPAQDRSGDSISRVVPREAIRLVISALRSDLSRVVKVRINEKSTQFVTDGLLLGTANLEGRYPDTSSILKGAQGNLVQEMAVGHMLHVARLAATMLTAEETGMVVSVEPANVIAEVEAPSVGSCALRITEGERDRELKTKFDVKYLRECLAVFDPNETMKWYQMDGEHAAYFHLPDEMVYVQMPMELKS